MKKIKALITELLLLNDDDFDSGAGSFDTLLLLEKVLIK